MARAPSARGGRQQTGMALLAMLMVLALVALLTVQLAAQSQRQLHRQVADLRAYQAQLYAESMANYFTGWLAEQAPTAAQPLPEQPPAWFTAFAQPTAHTVLELVDLTGRFNINNLHRQDGTVDLYQQQTLRRLLVSLGQPAATADEIIAAWPSELAPATELHLQAEPQLSHNRLVDTVQLASLPALSPPLGALFSGYLAALPAATAINIQTASPQLLAAALPGTAEQRLRAAKRTQPDSFDSLSALLSSAATVGRNSEPLVALQANASYYQLAISVVLGNVRLYWRATLHCSGEPCTVSDIVLLLDPPIMASPDSLLVWTAGHSAQGAL